MKNAPTKSCRNLPRMNVSSRFILKNAKNWRIVGVVAREHQRLTGLICVVYGAKLALFSVIVAVCLRNRGIRPCFLEKGRSMSPNLSLDSELISFVC